VSYRTGWEWRKAARGSAMSCPGESRINRWFHACGPDAKFACDPLSSLAESVEAPGENSRYCPACMDVVFRTPKATAR
jgi:hypothetical protein